jgi:hypothetical protein
MTAGSGRGVQRFGHIIADRISFTGLGDGIELPDGTVPEVDVPAAVETYLLQLPGSGPGTHLEMDAQGDLVWVANV